MNRTQPANLITYTPAHAAKRVGLSLPEWSAAVSAIWNEVPAPTRFNASQMRVVRRLHQLLSLPHRSGRRVPDPAGLFSSSCRERV